MRKSWLWLMWGLATVASGSLLAYTLLDGKDKSVFMPGDLSNGHHQIGLACDACHQKAFGGKEALQEACVECHGKEREKPFDSHPKAKFTDPRNADRLGDIDALTCLTCHVEHKPEITQKMGLTQAPDLCFHCHHDIAEDRPSHRDMPFDTCRSSGCHNFHDNRALYTNFLIKHLHEPENLPEAIVPQREFAAVLDEIIDYPHDRYPVRPLNLADRDAPQDPATGQIDTDWVATAHAQAGVNCSACHEAVAEDGETGPWQDYPGTGICTNCHDIELTRFTEGKHGMRLKQGLPPMTPAQARIPMQEDSRSEELTCLTCHEAHRFDTRKAAVDACLGCHADDHSLAYEDSPHFRLWEAELAGDLPAGSGVSCATCHMPRVDYDVNDWLRRVVVEHNQNATLTPSEKMLRPACMHCHGLEFSIDSLADPKLVRSNFQGRPGVHVTTMELAESEQQRRQEESGGDEDEDAGMFGF